MTDIKVDNIADAAGTGLPDFADGLTVADSAVSTLNVAQYYQDSAEPSSPMNGALWKDTANDKLMIYVADAFKEIELGAVASSSWTVDLSDVTYDSVSFNSDAQDKNPYEVAFGSSGTKMYITGSNTDSIYQYTLSTAFDVSTASYDSVSFSVASQEISPYAMAFNVDGTKMYIVGDDNDTVYQYSLSTAYDIGSASYDSVSFSVSSQDTGPQSLAFNTDGTSMYILGPNQDRIFQYTLSTGFDLSTASYNSVNFSVSAQDTLARSFSFNSDGSKLYVLGQSNTSVYQYSLSTAFDVSTASYDSVSFSVGTQDTVPFSLKFSDDGTKMYMFGRITEYTYQYSTGL